MFTTDHRQGWVISGLSVLLAATPLFAQIVPGMDGRANEASNLVGSGGRNIPVAPSIYNTGNLIVSGNVSRGGYFRGNSPIRDPNSFFTALPSSDLLNFRRDAIGLQQALNSPAPYQSTPYFDRTQTIGGLQALQAGLTTPGSNTLQSSYLAPRPLTTDYSNINPLSPTVGSVGASAIPPNSSIYTPENFDTLRGTYLYDRLRQTDHKRSLNESPVFGKTEITNRPIPGTQANPTDDPFALDLNNDRRLMIQPIVRESRTAAQVADQSEADRLAANELRSPTAIPLQLLRDPLAQQVLGSRQALQDSHRDPVQFNIAGTTNPSLTPLTQNRLLADPSRLTGDSDLAQLRFDPNANPLLNLADAVSVVTQYDSQPTTGEGDEIDAEAAPETPRYQRAMDIVRDVAARPVRSLAGDSQSRIDDLLRRAEAQVRKGDYYQAATLYELATSVDPTNPLVRLGYANSLAAAGEYVSSVLQLEQAVEAYPAFGFLNLDLNDFVRDPEDLDMRRADLEKRLDREEDYRLRFLLGYIETYSGFRKFGIPNLKKAAESAPRRSFIARFPEILEKRSKYLPKLEEPSDAPTDDTATEQ